MILNCYDITGRRYDIELDDVDDRFIDFIGIY